MATPPSTFDADPDEGYRQVVCTFRSHATCALISAELGWSHGLPLPSCDRCFDSGGPDSEASARVRSQLVQATINHFSQEHRLRRLPGYVRAAIATHKPELLPLIAGMPPSVSDQWEEVKTDWENADKLFDLEEQGLTSKVVSFLKALGSGRNIDPSLLKRRQISCFGDGDTKKPCPVLKQREDGLHWCGACGCGANPLSLLDHPTRPKLTFVQLRCPLKRDGFSNAQNLQPPAAEVPPPTSPLSPQPSR